MELVVEQGRLPAVSRDGKVLAFDSPGKEAQKTEWDLSYVALHGDRTPVRFVEAPTIQSQPRFSPDGRYLAYTSLESGRVEVYLKAFPSGDGKWQVSVNGGNVPRWSGIGDKLFYVERAPGSTEPKVLEVDVVMQPFLRLGTPRVLFTATGAVPAGWDVSPDGQRFIYLREVPNPRQETPALTVVENWFAEFKNRQVRKAQ
jgi:dipeptidyl aminopeptidase/acylaminoacyl peptidase